MTLRIVYRKAAKAELDEAILYYERQRTGVGEELLSEIDQAVMRAAAHPEHFPVVFDNIRRALAKRFPYTVFFRVRGSALVVLAVLHGRRDPAVWQRRA